MRKGKTIQFLTRLANPGNFLNIASRIQPWLNISAFITLTMGWIWGLFFSPPDWQQGDAVRIMYVHVPAAILASLGFALLAICGFVLLVWRLPLAGIAAKEIAPVGAAITAICLMTGSLWGKPMWGTWWVWDARLTSVLILFFLYLGHIILLNAFEDPDRGYRSAAILAIVGAIDLPIIKFSVNWWNTLHQPASLSFRGGITISHAILWPLLVSMIGFSLCFFALITARIRAAIMEKRIETRLYTNGQGDHL